MDKKPTLSKKKSYLRTIIFAGLFITTICIYTLAPYDSKMIEKTVYDQEKEKTIIYTDKIKTKLSYPYFEIALTINGATLGYIVRSFLD